MQETVVEIVLDNPVDNVFDKNLIFVNGNAGILAPAASPSLFLVWICI